MAAIVGVYSKRLFFRMFCMRADLYTSVAKMQSASPNKNGMMKKAAVCFLMIFLIFLSVYPIFRRIS